MVANKKTRIPSLRHCNGRGFVELNGQRKYLGPWRAPETQAAYECAIAEWLANKKLPYVDPEVITVAELCRDYWVHCQAYYVKADGSPTSSLDEIKQALRPLRKQYGSTLASDIGPIAVRTIQSQWIDGGLSRSTINARISILKRLFKWAASHEKIPIAVYQSIATLDGLRAGRTEAKESRSIRPAPSDHIDAVEPFVSREVWALIQLQLYTGARGGELLRLRPCDLNTTQEIWTAELQDHKTSYRGNSRVIYFGPNAQKILRRFMETTPIHGYLFSPQEAILDRHINAKTRRRPNQAKTPTITNRKLGDHYTSDSYRHAITRACAKAGVPSWTPHQLRHNAATMIRREYGLEAAQVILGHAKADVTQLYAEVDRAKALTVIQEIG